VGAFLPCGELITYTAVSGEAFIVFFSSIKSRNIADITPKTYIVISFHEKEVPRTAFAIALFSRPKALMRLKYCSISTVMENNNTKSATGHADD